MKNLTSYASAAISVKLHDKEAFEEFYSSEWDNVFQFARSILQCEAEAQDAAQDVFLRIIETIDSLGSPEKFDEWMERLLSETIEKHLLDRAKLIPDEILSKGYGAVCYKDDPVSCLI